MALKPEVVHGLSYRVTTIRINKSDPANLKYNQAIQKSSGPIYGNQKLWERELGVK